MAEGKRTVCSFVLPAPQDARLPWRNPWPILTLEVPLYQQLSDPCPLSPTPRPALMLCPLHGMPPSLSTPADGPVLLCPPFPASLLLLDILGALFWWDCTLNWVGSALLLPTGEPSGSTLSNQNITPARHRDGGRALEVEMRLKRRARPARTGQSDLPRWWEGLCRHSSCKVGLAGDSLPPNIHQVQEMVHCFIFRSFQKARILSQAL